MNLADYLGMPSPLESEARAFLPEDLPITILDIGACEGEDSIRYKMMFPRATIYSFEPLQRNIQRMQENFFTYGLHEQIKIMPYALSDADGWAEFYVSSGTPPGKENTPSWDYGNKSSSLLAPTRELSAHFGWLNFDSTIKVKTIRLCDFCAQEHIDRIDLIHMDVQGAELMVLKGAGEWLKKTKLVWLEVENVELYKSQPLKNDVERYMKTMQFIKIRDTVSSIAGDQCYINPRMVSPLKVYAYKAANYLRRMKKRLT